MDLEQSDPPESNRKGAHYWLNVVKHLRANPGIWYNLGTWIARGRRSGTRPRHFERAAYIKKNYELHSKRPRMRKVTARSRGAGRYIGTGIGKTEAKGAVLDPLTGIPVIERLSNKLDAPAPYYFPFTNGRTKEPWRLSLPSNPDRSPPLPGWTEHDGRPTLWLYCAEPVR